MPSHVPRHHAPGADQGIAADGNARRIDRAAAGPRVAANADRRAVLQPGFLLRRVPRMADPRRSPMGQAEKNSVRHIWSELPARADL